MLSDIFSILAFVLLFATTGFAYSFSASKNWSVSVKVISAIIGFSLAATLLCFLYIGTGFPGWMRWPVEFFFMPVKYNLLADNITFDPYAIPKDKSILKSCRQSALAAIPGKVTAFQIHNTVEGFYYRFEIEAKDRTVWTAVCEGASRKIIRTQRHE